MKRFTYTEYLKYQEYIANVNYFENGLKEDGKTYQYHRKEVYHKHDKIFREVLEDKKEVASFINKVLKLENTKEALQEIEIEKYNRKFITNSFRYTETDVIYRKKGEDIFFLIEHQSTIDYSMPYRILMYSLEIMKSAVDEKRLRNKDYQFPMVYPIIIYTGNKRWNVEKYIESKQQKIAGCEPVRFCEYNVIDINEYSENELLQEEMFLSKIMLLEKATTSQKMIEILEKIIKGDLTEKNINFLGRVICYIFDKEIGESETQKLLNQLSVKKGGKDMIEELLRKGFREEAEKIVQKERKKVMEEARRKGRKEGIEKGRKEGIEKGRKEGIEKGRKEGIEKGRREGIEGGWKDGFEIGKKEAIRMARQQLEKQWIIKMLKGNIKEQEIIEIAEISQEELEEIKSEMKEKAS